jgi:hypothetical protein
MLFFDNVKMSGNMMQMVAFGAQDFNLDYKSENGGLYKKYTGKHNFYVRIKERSIKKNMKNRERAYRQQIK